MWFTLNSREAESSVRTQQRVEDSLPDAGAGERSNLPLNHARRSIKLSSKTATHLEIPHHIPRRMQIIKTVIRHKDLPEAALRLNSHN